MFKKNTKHLQTGLFGLYSMLPDQLKKEVKSSEEYYFYKLVFCHIDEEIFSVLYSDKKSRPNAPVNALVSALILMAHNNWTYEQLFKQIKFNILVKIALGLDSLEEIPFSPATIFNFQNRINEHFVKTGENLLEQVFDRLTSEQLKKLKIKTNIQRTDSFVAVSNIRNYSRLQLLIEVILRVWRVLTEEDKERFRKYFQNYINKSSGQYIYSLKKEDFPRELEKIARLYRWIAEHIRARYSDKEIMKVFDRVYSEHFTKVKGKIRVKRSEELSSDMLQSPDDLDATYRKKNGRSYKGQSVNVVETANPENAVNLITDISVNPLNRDDSQVLNERIEHLKKKTPEMEELHFDGAYGSEANDRKFEELGIMPVQTGVRGAGTQAEIAIEKLADDHYRVSCPNQVVLSQKARKGYKADFDLSICAGCELREKCPTILKKKARVYYFGEKDYLAKKRKNNIKLLPPERRKLRNNVEATVKEFTCRMPGKKLKVRGLFKTTVFVYSVGIYINFGRIFRYFVGRPYLFAQFFVRNWLIFKELLGNYIHFVVLNFIEIKRKLLMRTVYRCVRLNSF